MDNKNEAIKYFDDGYTYFNEGYYDKAIESYTKAIELTPDFTKAYYNRGLAHFERYHLKEAIKDYTKAIEFEQNNAEFYSSRGNAYSYNQEDNKAIEDYTEVLRITPDDAVAYNQIGILYDIMNDYDKAIENFSKAIELKDDYAEAYHNRGLAYYYADDNGYDKAMKDYCKAIKEYTKIIDLNPNDNELYFDRGRAYQYKIIIYNTNGEYTKAIAADKKAKEDYKKHTGDYKKTFDSEVKNGKNIPELIFKNMNGLNEKGLNLNYLIEKLTDGDKVEELSIYEHILLYFLTLKEEDYISEVACYTSTRVLEKLIKKEGNNLNAIRMSTLSKVNDPAEGTELLKLLCKNTKKVIKEDSDTKEEYCIVQTSFTRCIDSLTMFRLYGKADNKEGTGASLVFDKNFFDTNFQYNQLPHQNNQLPSFQNQLPFFHVRSLSGFPKNKQPLYYVLYYNEKLNELIFNPYKSNYERKIVINLDDLKTNTYKNFEYPEKFSFVSDDDYSKVKNNIGYLLKKIVDCIEALKGEDIQRGYNALSNIKYLIKNSAFVEEQELRILKMVKYDDLDVDYEIKSVYKKYLEAVGKDALKKIILGSKIDNVNSVAETWKAHIKQMSKEDKRYEDIEVSISEAPFN